MEKKKDIVRIDLDEEKKEKEKIEIVAGDLFIRIPQDRKRIREAIKVLESFEEKEDMADPREEQKEEVRPIEKIEKEIAETKQFLDETKKKEEKIAEPIIDGKEDKTVLQDHKTYKLCPKCGNKLKRKKVIEGIDGLQQFVKCKNRKCGWTHEYLIKI